VKILVTALAALVLTVPAALAAPPEGRGKPQQAGAASNQDPNKNAAKRCKAERQAMGAQPFADKYGTNRNKRNAFGKCVSKAVANDTATEADDQREENAAKRCNAERQAMGAQPFADKYGTNANNRNAFGKCVSQKVKQTS